MKVVDLFCGCGGLSLGFQKAGYEVIAAFDNWDEAVTVYRNNFHHPVIDMDLSDEERSVNDGKVTNVSVGLQSKSNICALLGL